MNFKSLVVSIAIAGFAQGDLLQCARFLGQSFKLVGDTLSSCTTVGDIAGLIFFRFSDHILLISVVMLLAAGA